VNPVYAILTRAIFGAIDRIAGSDPKHGIRLSLENYIQFEASLKPLAATNAVLAFFVGRATGNKEKALQAENRTHPAPMPFPRIRSLRLQQWNNRPGEAALVVC